jgi:hypothetical protein
MSVLWRGSSIDPNPHTKVASMRLRGIGSPKLVPPEVDPTAARLPSSDVVPKGGQQQ